MPQVFGNSRHGFRHASLMQALSFVHSELWLHSGLGTEKAQTHKLLLSYTFKIYYIITIAAAVWYWSLTSVTGITCERNRWIILLGTVHSLRGLYSTTWNNLFSSYEPYSICNSENSRRQVLYIKETSVSKTTSLGNF